MKDSPPRLGFLGAGQMATALARGWLAAGLLRGADAALASGPLRRRPATPSSSRRDPECERQPGRRRGRRRAPSWPSNHKVCPSWSAKSAGRCSRGNLVLSIVTGGDAAGSWAMCSAAAAGWCASNPNMPCLVGASALGPCRQRPRHRLPIGKLVEAPDGGRRHRPAARTKSCSTP